MKNILVILVLFFSSSVLAIDDNANMNLCPCDYKNYSKNSKEYIACELDNVNLCLEINLPQCEIIEDHVVNKTACLLTYTWGDKKYVGEFKDGNFNGQGTEIEGDNSYVGEWKDGKKHGQGIITFADGGKYVGEFKDGNFNGQGTYIFANGDKYVGEWKDNNWNGQGTLTYENGDKYVGEWKDGKQNGFGTYTFANGDKEIGDWKNGRFVKSEENYKDGKKISEIDLLISQLKSCWIKPLDAVINKGMYIKIALKVNPDRTIISDSIRIIDTNISTDNIYYKSITESALNTLSHSDCQQLKLPLGKYDLWKNMTINFDHSILKETYTDKLPTSLFGISILEPIDQYVKEDAIDSQTFDYENDQIKKLKKNERFEDYYISHNEQKLVVSIMGMATMPQNMNVCFQSKMELIEIFSNLYDIDKTEFSQQYFKTTNNEKTLYLEDTSSINYKKGNNNLVLSITCSYSNIDLKLETYDWEETAYLFVMLTTQEKFLSYETSESYFEINADDFNDELKIVLKNHSSSTFTSSFPTSKVSLKGFEMYGMSIFESIDFYLTDNAKNRKGDSNIYEFSIFMEKFEIKNLEQNSRIENYQIGHNEERKIDSIMGYTFYDSHEECDYHKSNQILHLSNLFEIDKSEFSQKYLKNTHESKLSGLSDLSVVTSRKNPTLTFFIECVYMEQDESIIYIALTTQDIFFKWFESDEYYKYTEIDVDKFNETLLILGSDISGF